MARFSMSGRIAAGVVAAVGWLGLGRYVAAEVATQGGDWLRALWVNAGFLTDLSNTALAVVMTGVALGVRRLSGPHVVGWATAVIATVGVGFWLIGGHLEIGKSALEDILLHAVTPWAGLLVWLVFAPKGGLRWRTSLIWLAWPAAYWTYALTRGALSGEYAYGFLDPRPHGVGPVMQMVAMLVCLYAAWALALLGLDRWMRPSPTSADPS